MPTRRMYSLKSTRELDKLLWFVEAQSAGRLRNKSEIRSTKSEGSTKSEISNGAACEFFFVFLPSFVLEISFGFRASDLFHDSRRTPYHLRNLAKVGAEVQLEVDGPVTQRSVLDALEAHTQCCAAPFAITAQNEAPSVSAVLRLQSGPVAALAGRTAAGRRGQRDGTVLVVGAIAGG